MAKTPKYKRVLLKISGEALEAAAKDLGAPIEVAGFHRFQLGEGVEREKSDFAAEVAAQLGR